MLFFFFLKNMFSLSMCVGCKFIDSANENNINEENEKNNNQIKYLNCLLKTTTIVPAGECLLICVNMLWSIRFMRSIISLFHENENERNKRKKNILFVAFEWILLAYILNAWGDTHAWSPPSYMRYDVLCCIYAAEFKFFISHSLFKLDFIYNFFLLSLYSFNLKRVVLWDSEMISLCVSNIFSRVSQ